MTKYADLPCEHPGGCNRPGRVFEGKKCYCRWHVPSRLQREIDVRLYGWTPEPKKEEDE